MPPAGRGLPWRRSPSVPRVMARPRSAPSPCSTGRSRGGRVAGLRIPISGRIGGPAGGFAFGRGCIEARFQSLRAGALRLGATRLPICARPARRSSTSAPTARCGSAPRPSNLRLAGALGHSPFRLNAANARMTDSDRFASTRMAMQLGKPTSPVRIDAATLTGRFAGGGSADVCAAPMRPSAVCRSRSAMAAGNWASTRRPRYSTAR